MSLSLSVLMHISPTISNGIPGGTHSHRSRASNGAESCT